jgi:hypothetical protein
MNMNLKIEHNNHVDNLCHFLRIIEVVGVTMTLEMTVLVLTMNKCRGMKIAVEEIRIRTSKI